MSKGRHARKSTGAGKIILIVILVLILAGAAIFAAKFFAGKDSDDSNVSEESDLVESTDISEEISRQPEAEEESSEIPDESSRVTENSESEPESSSEDTNDETSSQAPEDSSEDKPESSTTELPQQVDAEYERWLASSMVMGISMEYADFEIKGIYAEAATALKDKEDSKGVYVVFTSGGSDYAIYSKPIPEERTEAGTCDLSSMTTGFSTFDLVDASSVPSDAAVQYSIDDLQETIAQSMLVSIYYH